MKKKKRYVNLIIGIVLIAILALVALLAPVIATHSYEEANLSEVLAKPSSEHLFGTDYFGRDVFSRVVYGSRIAFKIAGLSVCITTVLGVVVGLLAGYFGGWIDRILCFIMDVTWSVPNLVAAFAIISILGKSLDNSIIAIALVTWPQLARIVRTKTMSIKNMAFIETGEAFGEGIPVLLFRYILPNIIPAIVVIVSRNLPNAIMSTTALSVLGLGASSPSPDWGLAISDGMSYFTSHPLPSLFPGLALMYTTFGFTMLGEGLRDYIDPRMKDN